MLPYTKQTTFLTSNINVQYHLFGRLVFHINRPECDGAVPATGGIATLRIVDDGRHVATNHVRDDDDPDDGLAMLGLDEADVLGERLESERDHLVFLATLEQHEH